MRHITPEEIRASLERDAKDPVYMANLQASLDEMRSGKFMSWRVALLPLPNWAKRAVSAVVDRRIRRVISAATTENTQPVVEK